MSGQPRACWGRLGRWVSSVQKVSEPLIREKVGMEETIPFLKLSWFRALEGTWVPARFFPQCPAAVVLGMGLPCHGLKEQGSVR